MQECGNERDGGHVTLRSKIVSAVGFAAWIAGCIIINRQCYTGWITFGEIVMSVGCVVGTAPQFWNEND